MSAPKGNKNAVKAEAEHTPEPLMTSISLKHDRRERLRAAMIAYEGGGWPSDDEIKKFSRSLYYRAVDAFIERMERENEDAMII